MIIDDSKTIRTSAVGMLEAEGYAVVTAVDGFDALAKVVEHEPDIIFADIMMPRLDGYQACALIKNNARYAGIPVVLLSSRDSIFDKARGRIVGSEHYLTKPFTRRDLLAAIRRHATSPAAPSDCSVDALSETVAEVADDGSLQLTAEARQRVATRVPAAAATASSDLSSASEFDDFEFADASLDDDASLSAVLHEDEPRG